MSLESTIAGLVTAANNLTTAVNGKIAAINTTLANALAQFNEWRNLKDVEGDPSAAGTIRRNMFQGFINNTGQNGGAPSSMGGFPITNLGSGTNVYAHFKLPLNVNTHAEMFWFNLKGYLYGSAMIVEETIVGYCYAPTRSLRNVSTFGNLNPSVYTDAAGNVIMRILMPDSFYATVRIDTMRVGNGRLFNVGDITAVLSLAETVNF